MLLKIYQVIRLYGVGMRVYWKDAEKTIIIREVSETLSWDDYDSSIQKTFDMMREVNHDVYLIFDASQLGSVPKNSLEHFTKAARGLPPNVALRIMVTRNNLLQTLVGVLQKVIPENFLQVRIVSTLEEPLAKVTEEKHKREQA